MLERLRRSLPRQGLAAALFYEFCWDVLMVVQTALLRLRCFHAERMPSEGACIMVGNHQSFFDSTVIGMCLRDRQMHSIAREGLFANPAMLWLLHAVNTEPIREDAGDMGAMRLALAKLARGEPVLLFPEGSRSEDGLVHPFKRGVSLLVRRSGAPVVPFAVEGTFDAWSRHRTLPRLFGNRAGVMVGRPIPADELMKDGPDSALRRLEREIDGMRCEIRRRLDAASGQCSRPLDRLASARPA